MRRIALFTLTACALLLGAGLTSAPARAQPNPAQSLVGQRITVCKGAERFRFTVVSADWREVIVDRSQPGSVWAVAIADVTSLNADYSYFQQLVDVRDDRNRVFQWVLYNGPDIYVEDELALAYNVTPSWAGVNPGQTVRTAIPFLVSADARSLLMIANNIGCEADSVATIAPPSGGGATAPRPASSGPSTAAPASGGAVRTPASPLVGQSVTACKGEERYRFTVVAADWREVIVDRSEPGSMWAVVVVDVTTLTPGLGYFQQIIAVRDNRGRQFDWVLYNGPDIYVEDELAGEYGVQASWLAAGPVGRTVRTVVPFLVSSDATSLTLIPYNIGCDGQ